MTGKSGGVGGAATNPGGLQQGDRIRGRGRAPGALLTANDGQEASKCYVKIDLAAAGERRWKFNRHGGGRRGREVAESESDAGRDGTRYTGTETGDAQVGK